VHTCCRLIKCIDTIPLADRDFCALGHIRSLTERLHWLASRGWFRTSAPSRVGIGIRIC